MATLTASQIYTLLLQGGFDPQQARMMTAIAQAESARNPGAIGDVALQTATWGPSVGLFQIRTLKSETGTGSDRDIQRLMNNPAEQVKAARNISTCGPGAPTPTAPTGSSSTSRCRRASRCRRRPAPEWAPSVPAWATASAWAWVRAP